jgi:propionate CoA-transferase
MSYVTQYDPALAAEPGAPPAPPDPMPLDERKVVARRALLEARPGDAVNLGIGLPEGVAGVAAEEGVLRRLTLTTQAGVHGGVGAAGGDFGPARGYAALLALDQQFDFYSGGGLDACFLGMAGVTAAGDVNVTRVGPALKGVGGFVDISQSTPRVNLLGAFTAGGLRVAVAGGRVVVAREGAARKFVRAVPEAAFSGANAAARGQRVRYITERCVFALTPAGLELEEIAPGIDLQTQVRVAVRVGWQARVGRQAGRDRLRWRLTRDQGGGAGGGSMSITTP